jgi:hypothetical protein
MYVNENATSVADLQTKIGLFSGDSITGVPTSGWVQYLSIPLNDNGSYPSVLAFNDYSEVYTGKSGSWTKLATSTDISTLQTSFQAGCSTIASAITAHGVSTASNASPSTMSSNIDTVANNYYNSGYSAGAAAKGISVAAILDTGQIQMQNYASTLNYSTSCSTNYGSNYLIMIQVHGEQITTADANSISISGTEQFTSGALSTQNEENAITRLYIHTATSTSMSISVSVNIKYCWIRINVYKIQN